MTDIKIDYRALYYIGLGMTGGASLVSLLSLVTGFATTLVLVIGLVLSAPWIFGWK